MKRIAVPLFAVLIAVPVAALAEPAPGIDTDSTPASPVLEQPSVQPPRDGSLRAAAATYRIDAITPEVRVRLDRPAWDVRPVHSKTAVTATRAAAQTGTKSFWRTPWPYVLIGGGAVVLIVATRGDGY